MAQDASSDHTGSPTCSKDPGAPEIPFEAQLHAVIADHKLIRCIGRGSYGEVWLARHTMGMYRAVKIVHRKYFKDRHPFERELCGIRKFEPISRSHRGFIDILHVGMHEAGEYFYYVMELGDDQTTGSQIQPDSYWPKTLSRELRAKGTLDCQQGLQLGLDLSRALAELHRTGLVHRDIKPSNILFVNGVPKLADIGLVSQADEARSYVGTEGFIPPEGPGTARADVYALGKVLYEAITGKDRLEYPELPPDWDSRPGHEKLRELNEVILQACNAAPERYETAEDMHADLVVLLAGKSVRRLKTLERQVARIKRVGALSCLGLATAAGLFYLILRERNMSLQVREGRVSMLLAQGNSAMDAGDVAGALPYFAEAKVADQGNQRRGTEHDVRLGSVIEQCPKISQMWFEPTDVSQASISTDGQRVLVIQSLGSARIFDVITGRPVGPGFAAESGLLGGTFNKDASLVATASEDEGACVWRVHDGRKLRAMPHGGRILSVEFSADSRTLVSGCTDSQAWVWDVETATTKLKLVGHTGAVLFATFSHNGKLIATASRDSTARIWDAMTGRQIGAPLQHAEWVQFVGFSPDDTMLVTGCEDHKARVWNVKTREHIRPDLPHDDVVSSVGFSPDGRLILTSSFDGTARLWHTDDHQPFFPAPILRHSGRVWHAAFAADGRRIISCCTDGTVRIWDLAGAAVPVRISRTEVLCQDKSRFLRFSTAGLQLVDTWSQKPLSPLFGPKGNVTQCSLGEDGAFVLCASTQASQSNATEQWVQVWKCQTGQVTGPRVGWTNGLATLRLSGDGKLLLGFAHNVAYVFDTANGREIARLRVETGDICSALFSQTAAAVAVWTKQVLTVFNTEGWQIRFPSLTHPFPIKAVEFSDDGGKLVTCGADASLDPCYARVWDAFSGKPLTPELMHGDGVLCSSFSPGGRLVVTGGEDSKAVVWDAQSGKRLATVKHHDRVLGVTFARDEASFLTASRDKTARLWSAETGYPLTPMLLHHVKVTEAKMLPGHPGIVTRDLEERAWLWRLPVDRRPVEDALRLARLLSGEIMVPASRNGRIPGESLEQAWQKLQDRQPGEVTISSEQIANWYDFQADESQVEDNPSAAIFYLERLKEFRPDDDSISARLARLRQKVQSSTN